MLHPVMVAEAPQVLELHIPTPSSEQYTFYTIGGLGNSSAMLAEIVNMLTLGNRQS